MRGIEIIQGTLQGWTDSFMTKFGRKVPKKQFISTIEEMLEQKEVKAIRETFATWEPEDLRLLIKEAKISKLDTWAESKKAE